MFPKLDMFPSSGEGGGTSTLLGMLERANPNHWPRCPAILSVIHHPWNVLEKVNWLNRWRDWRLLHAWISTDFNIRISYFSIIYQRRQFLNYTASDGVMTDHLKRTSCVLTKVQSLHLCGVTKENWEISQTGWLVQASLEYERGRLLL
jgi:hypothetical protein